jgi:hypothetical protein
VTRAEAPAGLPHFRWPRGVVPTIEAARTLRPVEGHLRSQHDATLAIEAVVAGDRLLDVFLDVVERLPVADNVEVRITGQYDDAGTAEVWLSPRIDVKKAIRFLDDHDVELLGNGHIDVAIYLRADRSTLRLTEHKTLVWLTESAELADRFAAWMTERAVPAVDELQLIAAVDHYHWRPASARSRVKLLEHLHRARLRKVDSWTDPP